ncbi:hypothetical protein TcasGA2_TC003724 [Tribolium castaneum]|uniref:Uncharacterized protein n=1 Tax=Tribolium castaneum TaxID=7070 RepID=D6WDV7_TRICA|nr:hypothetical protein TcasGA2_TC003724 [Tribolium castaneum]
MANFFADAKFFERRDVVGARLDVKQNGREHNQLVAPQTIHAWSGPIQSRNLSYQFLLVEPAKSRQPPPPSLVRLITAQPRRMGRHLVPSAVILHVVVFV